ncbi:unnamed protein product [Ceutorhynchus assimilis]|uniref:NADP-dependent oxidoreductase domain-containing protein n=1 Tax=Ceutorhynchus assimilis TaxID=467358 RepID=A0A9N9QMD8_9CUCU|nr:unnamed protein product [Ceutorhynchus assimilis]
MKSVILLALVAFAAAVPMRETHEVSTYQYLPEARFYQQGNAYSYHVPQFIAYQFHQAQQLGYTPIQVQNYLLEHGFPRFVAEYLSQQYGLGLNQTYFQSPYEIYQYYYKLTDMPQEVKQYILQQVESRVSQPFHQYFLEQGKMNFSYVQARFIYQQLLEAQQYIQRALQYYKQENMSFETQIYEQLQQVLAYIEKAMVVYRTFENVEQYQIPYYVAQYYVMQMKQAYQYFQTVYQFIGHQQTLPQYFVQQLQYAYMSFQKAYQYQYLGGNQFQYYGSSQQQYYKQIIEYIENIQQYIQAHPQADYYYISQQLNFAYRYFQTAYQFWQKGYMAQPMAQYAEKQLQQAYQYLNNAYLYAQREESNTKDSPTNTNMDHTAKDTNTDHTAKDSNTDHTAMDTNTDHTPMDTNTDHTPMDTNMDHTANLTTKFLDTHNWDTKATNLLMNTCQLRTSTKLTNSPATLLTNMESSHFTVPMSRLLLLSKPGEVEQAVKDAIDIGYRHIDCAFAYGNENEVGAALRAKFADGTVKREDLWITSKLWNTYHRPDLVEVNIKKSLSGLGLDYLDLYLIHWPTGYKEGGENMPKDEAGNIIFSDVDYLDTWKAMEELVRKDLTKSIGFSNFNKAQITRILENCTIQPAVLQIECHPYLNQSRLIQFAKSKGLAITAYSPLGSPDRPWAQPGDPQLMEDPKLVDLAKKYNKTPAQILLRYQLDREVITIPKSVTKSRIQQNFDIFDFKLAPEDIAYLDGFDVNGRLCPLAAGYGHKYHPFEHDEI